MMRNFQPRCSVCSKVCASIEIIPPHELPLNWDEWMVERKEAFDKYRDAEKFYLCYSGPGGSNGWVGDPVDLARVQRIQAAFAEPFQVELIRAAGFYDNAGYCLDCSVFYCAEHWRVSSSGGGVCPNGHAAGLDPHWHPDSD